MAVVTTNLRTELVKRLTEASARLVADGQRQDISKQEYIRVNVKALSVLASIQIVMDTLTTDDVDQFLAVKKVISDIHQVYCDNDTNDFTSGSRSGYALVIRYMEMVLKIAQRDCA